MTEQFPPTAEQLAELAGRGSAIAESVSAAATLIEWQHLAVAGEVFDVIGPIAGPVARMHDVIAGAAMSRFAVSPRRSVARWPSAIDQISIRTAGSKLTRNGGSAWICAVHTVPAATTGLARKTPSASSIRWIRTSG